MADKADDWRGAPAPPAESLAEMAAYWDIQEYQGSSAITGMQWIIPPDWERWSIILFSGGGNWSVSNPPASAGVNWGIPQPNTNSAIMLNYREHGGLVQMGWGVILSGISPFNPRAITVAWRRR